MNVERMHQIILAPVISEKATRVAEKRNQAVFKVALDAKKPKVSGVRTLNVKGKNKRFGQSTGRRSDWKKAYVSLAAGQELDLGAGNAA